MRELVDAAVWVLTALAVLYIIGQFITSLLAL